jgi:hypothetical protein
MIRAGAIATVCAASLTLSGCYGWTGTSALKSSDTNRYAGWVSTSPAVFLVIVPAMALAFNYSVASCWDGPGTLKGVPGLIVGADPLDRVCTQYPGVDLRKYPATTKACFPQEPYTSPDGTVHPMTGRYLHPWLSNVSTPECATLVADIERAKNERTKKAN